MTSRRAQPRTSGRVRTPTILQMEAVECGAASLAMILSYYGRFIPLEQLRVDCGVSRDGSNAAQLAKAARKHGLEASGKKYTLDDIRNRASRPCVLFWGFGHFLVFEGMKGKQFQLNDPAGGRRLVDEEEFSKSFTGIAVEFAPGPEFKRVGSAPSLLRGFHAWLRGNRIPAMYAVACGILLSIPGVLIPGLSSAFINGVVLGGDVSSGKWLILGMVVMVLLQIGLILLQAFCINRMQFRMFMVQAVRMGEHLLVLPMRFFKQRSVGDLVSRFTSNQVIAAHLSSGLLTGLVNMVTALIYAAALFLFNPLIGSIAIGATVLLIVAVRVTNVKLVDRNTALQQDIGRQYGALMMMLRDIPEIKATSREGEAFGQWAGYQAKGVNAQQSVARITTWLDGAPVFVGGLIVSVIVLVLGGWEVMEGNMTIGGLVAMQMLAGLLISPVSQLVMLARILQTTQAQMNRVLDVMNYKTDPGLRFEVQESVTEAEKLGGAVRVDSLTFGFDHTADPLLHDMSFEIEPGRAIALVGASGCGKTTIIDLLLGLEQPWTGEIRLDGTPRDEIDLLAITGSIAGASGSVTAFGASLRNNVTMWDASIPDEQVVRALQDADCLELMDRPGGLDMKISEGGRNLSGGQVQRLEIARSLVRSPSLLLLDGATSALDGACEARVLNSIRARGSTMILVTERASALQHVDEVFIVRDGAIADRGRPDELAGRNDWFRDEFGGGA
jgi:NHLM bacteriocin system ABC transporter peptidase/ATP-binding protein